MRISLLVAFSLAMVGVFGLSDSAIGQSDASANPRVATIPAGPATPSAVAGGTPARPLKFTFLLFWKDDNANTQQMAEALKAAAARRPGRFEWSSVNINDPQNQLLVEQYQVGRTPMPLAVCVASNGAITGAYMRQLNDLAVERSLVTPVMADVTKALQDKKIVLLHIKSASNSPLPASAVEFAADPDFRARTTTLSFVLTDPTEKRFLTDMKVSAGDVHDSMLVVMAPPAVLVGKFPATITKDQIVANLHAAGKCCDDPNCKHNKAAQQ